ncbi:MAG: nucleotide pyrophosphohydrolase [Lachnospiraceae bacterium]|nr:nucleotide pyrophosphohydrolase [Lachnospiraceae bacterium]
MTEFTLNEMQEMQKALQDNYKDIWPPLCPETGKNQLLWMLGEVGEVIDIIKKHGVDQAAKREEIRKELVEELADVLMYYNDVLLCYGITPEELKQVYTEKFERNMKRWKQ